MTWHVPSHACTPRFTKIHGTAAALLPLAPPRVAHICGGAQAAVSRVAAAGRQRWAYRRAQAARRWPQLKTGQNRSKPVKTGRGTACATASTASGNWA
jgi:hypothetical protein